MYDHDMSHVDRVCMMQVTMSAPDVTHFKVAGHKTLQINSYDQWLRQSACSQTTSYLKYLITIEIFATTPLSLYGNGTY